MGQDVKENGHILVMADCYFGTWRKRVAKTEEDP